MPQRKKILAINLEAEAYDKIAPLLDRGEFDLDRFPRASHAAEILAVVEFDGLIAGYPLPNGSARPFFDQLRAPGAKNRSTPVLLLVHDEDEEDARHFLGRGASRVVRIDDTIESLQREVGALMNVAPRTDLRFMLRLKVELEAGKQLALGQTENVSRTGMLVSGGELYPIGSQVSFEFFLGQESQPVCGQGVVVRHATPGRESPGGVGIQFRSLEKDGQRRLDRYLSEGPRSA